VSEFGRRFDPSELENGDPAGNGDAAAAELLVIARDLEAFASSESVTPSVDFEDRVMAALADEPPPRAVSAGGLVGLVALVRDAWRLTWSGGRPLAVRAQALAFVLLAAVALGSLGSLAAVGVGKVLSPATPPPTVAPAPLPTPTPSLVPSPSSSPSVTPTPSPTPSPTASPTQGTAEPTETVEPTETGDDSSGPGSGGTPRPTSDSSGTGSGSGSDSSGPKSGSDDDKTPRPTDDSLGAGSGDDSSGKESGSSG
jgi:hypothetical protein